MVAPLSLIKLKCHHVCDCNGLELKWLLCLIDFLNTILPILYHFVNNKIIGIASAWLIANPSSTQWLVRISLIVLLGEIKKYPLNYY